MKDSYVSKYSMYLTLSRFPSTRTMGSIVPSPMQPVNTMTLGENLDFWCTNFLFGFPRGR